MTFEGPSLLAEAVQIDGGVIVLFFLVMLALFLTFVGLCWASYRAGRGSRRAGAIVAIALVVVLVPIVFDPGSISVIGPAIVIVIICGVIGRLRSRRDDA